MNYKAETLTILKCWEQSLHDIIVQLDNDGIDYHTAIDWADIKADSYMEDLKGANSDATPKLMTAEQWRTRTRRLEIRHKLEEFGNTFGVQDQVNACMEDLIELAFERMEDFDTPIDIAVDAAIEDFDIVIDGDD